MRRRFEALDCILEKRWYSHSSPLLRTHGYAFVRVDLEGSPVIVPKAEYVVDTQRGTNLEKNGVSIHTSEHVLAAAVGLGITNLIIEIDAAEPPIMDGSSKYFVAALEDAGIVEQEMPIEEYIVKEIISYKEEATGSEIMIMPSEEYQVTAMVDFGTQILGTQNAKHKFIVRIQRRDFQCEDF